MSDPTDVFALPETLRVLVTAGASGIGRATADLLAARGARVHICDVSDEFLADYRAAHPDGRSHQGGRRLRSGRGAPVRRRQSFPWRT